MAEKSYFWDGIATGHATEAPYTSLEWQKLFKMLLTYDNKKGGVLRTNYAVSSLLSPETETYSGNLEVSKSTYNTNSVVVAPGVAIVDGCIYMSSISQSISVSCSGTDIWAIIGLVKNSADQTVRLFSRSPFSSYDTAVESLVQSSEVMWEIPLAAIFTDSAGVVQDVRDMRDFSSPSAMNEKTGFGGMHRINTVTTDASPVASVTYTIPSGYTHLILDFKAKSDYVVADYDGLKLTFGGDPSAAYRRVCFYSSSAADGYSTSHPETAYLSMDRALLCTGTGADILGRCYGKIFIYYYNDTTSFKTVDWSTTLMGTSYRGIAHGAGAWQSYLPATSITLAPLNGANFLGGSYFFLEGL
jgi:hypothetical protein